MAFLRTLVYDLTIYCVSYVNLNVYLQFSSFSVEFGLSYLRGLLFLLLLLILVLHLRDR